MSFTPHTPFIVPASSPRSPSISPQVFRSDHSVGLPYSTKHTGLDFAKVYSFTLHAINCMSIHIHIYIYIYKLQAYSETRHCV